jgi:hypothetical protein
MYISNVSEVCCKCSISMFQVDRDVAMAIHVCFKCMFPIFICFRCMLEVFHLDVAYVLQWLHMCFLVVSDVCCKYFTCFGRMLQVFHLDVAKVDRSGVAHVAIGPTYRSLLLQLLGHRRGSPCGHLRWQTHIGAHPQAEQVIGTHVGIGGLACAREAE